MSYDRPDDFLNCAAHHLRKEAKTFLDKDIGSSHAHALVAGFFGCASKKALTSTEEIQSPTLNVGPDAKEAAPYITETVLKKGLPDPESQFLNRHDPDVKGIISAIHRMKTTQLAAIDAQWIASTISDGLTPACEVSGKRSAENVPVINPRNYKPMGWVHPTKISDGGYGRCVICHDVFRSADLDLQSLCPEHRGELDDHESEE